ncbi:MAG TPA: citramalate synthase, partial [Acidimicrobiia bacterium]
VEEVLGDGRAVFYDAEHFFDGYRRNSEFSLRVLEGAAQAGATRLVLCDTNGGTLPDEVERIVREVVAYFGSDVGIAVHLHDDAGTGVANALAGVRGGAIQVQGTINGYGERTGNCNLTTIIPNLTLKMGIETIPADRLERLTPVAHHVAELVNMALNPQAPYVGMSAFAHKAGLHVSAIAKRPDAYEHVQPDSVGNGTRFVVSELAGRSTLTMKAKELGLTLDGPQLNELVDTLKRMEHEGYHFEVADASLELLMRRAAGWEQQWFEVESYRVITDDDAFTTPGAATTEATIKVHVGGERVIATAEGNGPVNALDAALRKAIGGRYPTLGQVHLTDYKVRVLDTAKGTGAVTRVLVDSTNGDRAWTTIGVSENIIEASWQALYDSLVYGLLLGDAAQ